MNVCVDSVGTFTETVCEDSVFTLTETLCVWIVCGLLLKHYVWG